MFRLTGQNAVLYSYLVDNEIGFCYPKYKGAMGIPPTFRDHLDVKEGKQVSIRQSFLASYEVGKTTSVEPLSKALGKRKNIKKESGK